MNNQVLKSDEDKNLLCKGVIMAEIFHDDETARFFQLVHLFQRSALLQMGQLPDTEGNVHYNMAEAKEAIDLLRMLQNKTKGNLQDIETSLLNGVVSELQLQFMKAPSIHRKRQQEQNQSDAIRDTFANPQKGPVEDLSGSQEEEE
jgi:hypothetical protein